MGEIDWEEILAVDSTSLQDDEEKAEKMFSILAEVSNIIILIKVMIHCAFYCIINDGCKLYTFL